MKRVGLTLAMCIAVMLVARIGSADEWYTTFGYNQEDKVWGISVDSSHNCYWAGWQTFTTATVYPDITVRKMQPDKTLLWLSTWNNNGYGEEAFETLPDETRNQVLVSGMYFFGTQISQTNGMILSFDMPDGAYNWVWSYNGPSTDWEEVDGITVEGDYLYVSAWYSQGSGYSLDQGVWKLDLSVAGTPTKVWSIHHGSTGWDTADGEHYVGSSYVFVCGRYAAWSLLWGGNSYIAKYDKADGSMDGSKSWGTANLFGVLDFLGMCGDGTELYVTGYTTNYGNAAQTLYQRWDTSLNQSWERKYGGTGDEFAREIRVDDDNDLVIANNSTTASHGLVDAQLLKIGKNASTVYISSLWGGTSDDDIHGLCIDGTHAYLAGDTKSTGYAGGSFNWLMLKVDHETPTWPTFP